MTQAERLAEAARNERVNKKTLHRWEEAEEARAAERQAKIDAMKNRKMEGSYVRFYSGPAIFVDGKVKYTGKDAPTLEHLEEKLNKEPSTTDSQAAQENLKDPSAGQSTQDQATQPASSETPPVNGFSNDHPQRSQDSAHDLHNYYPTSASVAHSPAMPIAQSQTSYGSQLPWTAVSQASGGDVFMGSHGMSQPNSVMFAPPNQDPFLFGIDQYASHQSSQSTPSDLPPNPFTQASPYNSYTTSQNPFPQQLHTALNDPTRTNHGPTTGPQALFQQLQQPNAPPAPPRRKSIKRALRNLLILSDFSNLDLPPSSSRAKTTASLTKDKDRAALIQLSTTLFNWSLPDATAFVNTMLAAQTKATKRARAEHEAALKPVKPLCAVTNAVARYRDPETGIAYRDARAFGVLRGVVGGGFVWSGDLGCYVGGRAKPLESMGGKGFLGMPPAKGVPRRFLEMQKPVGQPQKSVEGVVPPVQIGPPVEVGAAVPAGESIPPGPSEVKMEGSKVVT